MESTSTLPKSSSNPMMRTISKELKKIHPIGASQNRRCNLPTFQKKKPESILEKRRFTLEDQNKYTTPALSNYLETHFKISTLYSNNVLQLPESTRRMSSPQVLNRAPYNLTPEKSSEAIRRQTLKRHIAEDISNENKKTKIKGQKSSKNIKIIDGIMNLCDEVSSPKNPVSERIVNNYTQHIKKFVNDMGDYFDTSPETLRIQLGTRNKTPSSNLKGFQAKEIVRKMIKTNEDEKNWLKFTKHRAPSSPKANLLFEKTPI